MIDLIGLIVIFILLCWATLYSYFATIPIFGEALFTGKWWEKLIGVLIWVGVVVGWLWFFIGITVELNY